MASRMIGDVVELNEIDSESVEENEWAKLIKARFKEGFVEGKYMGGESTVQYGFDRGYQKGFALSYPISVLKGLLTANEILLKETHPESCERSQEIKQTMNDFEEKLRKFDLLRNETNKNVPDANNENLDSSSSRNENEDSCNFVNISCGHFNEMNEELNSLKKHILTFLKDFSQPLIYDQIAHYVENWNLQILPTGVKADASDVTATHFSHNENF